MITRTQLVILGAGLLIAAFPVYQFSRGTMAEQKATGSVSPALGIAAPARDGNIAIREEYDLALAEGTIAAMQLFIGRHPGHPLVEEAERQLQLYELNGENKPQ